MNIKEIYISLNTQTYNKLFILMKYSLTYKSDNLKLKAWYEFWI